MNILTDIRDFLFPRLCMACGRKLQVSEQALCCDCLSQLPHTHLGNTPGNEMEKIFWGRFPIQRASALFYYARGGKVAHILAGMKYYGRQKVCRQMGEMLAHELLPTGFFEGVDYLLPVPLHPDRLRTRDITRVVCWQRAFLSRRAFRCATGCSVGCVTIRPRPINPCWNGRKTRFIFFIWLAIPVCCKANM